LVLLLVTMLLQLAHGRVLTPPDPDRYVTAQAVGLANTLSAGIGYPVSQAFFQDAAVQSRGSFCRLYGNTFFPTPDGRTYPSNEEFTCAEEAAGDDVCFSAAEVRAAFADEPAVLASLQSRYDLDPLVIDSQPSLGGLIMTGVFRILAQEIGGYRVKHQLSPAFRTSLFRCEAGLFDFHAELWRSDWSDHEWNNAFLGSNEKLCNYNGINGLNIFNGWWTDNYSILRAANNTAPGDQPLALDFWRAYATPEGVAGLPQFNLTDALRVPAMYDFPPLCDTRLPGSVPCGIIYAYSRAFEPGIMQAQIANLDLRLAIHFIPGGGSQVPFNTLIANRVRARQHVLFMIGSLSSLVTGPYFDRVSLPTINAACIRATASAATTPAYDCEFRSQNLVKANTRMRQGNSEYNDAYSLFSRMNFNSQEMAETVGKLNTTFLTPDAACLWLRENPQKWVPWFTVATPRVRTITLPSDAFSAVVVLSVIYFAVAVASMAALFRFRGHPIVRRASHLFCQLILVGAALFYVTLIVGVLKETKTTCTVAQFLFSGAFTLFWGSLLIKTFRIYVIHTSKQLQSHRLPDSTMLLFLLAYGAVDLLIVALWAGISPPTAVLHAHTSDPYARVPLCDSAHSVAFSTALYVWRGLALLAGGILAIRIRGVDDDFSESKFLGLMSYNILSVAAVILLLTLLGSRAPLVSALSWLVGVTLAVFVSSLLFVLSKLLGILRAKRRSRSPKDGDVKAAAAGAAASGMGSNLSPDIGSSFTRTPAHVAQRAFTGYGGSDMLSQPSTAGSLLEGVDGDDVAASIALSQLVKLHLSPPVPYAGGPFSDASVASGGAASASSPRPLGSSTVPASVARSSLAGMIDVEGAAAETASARGARQAVATPLTTTTASQRAAIPVRIPPAEQPHADGKEASTDSPALATPSRGPTLTEGP
jgi:hypothetical protein